MTTWDPDGSGPEPELIVVNGGFHQAGGVEAYEMAAWDGERWRSLGRPYTSEGTTHSLTDYQGQLVKGTSSGVWRWTGSRWTPIGAAFQGEVRALIDYGGELVAAGAFTAIGDQSIGRIARWDGQIWQPLSVGVNGHINALYVFDGDIIAGGRFSLAGGEVAEDIARWNGEEWRPMTNGLRRSTTSEAKTFAIFDGRLLVGGELNDGRQSTSVFSWDGECWYPFGAQLLGYLRDMAVVNGELFVLGGWNMCRAQTGVVRWDGARWLGVAGPGRSCEYFGNALRLVEYRRELIIAGSFSSLAGEPLHNIARWDGEYWAPLGRGFDAPVRAFTRYNGDLVAVGSFRWVDGVRCNGVARRVDGVWLPFGQGLENGGSGCSYQNPSDVTAAVPWNGGLLASGNFCLASGVEARGLAFWNGSAWSPFNATPWPMNGSGVVNAFTYYNGELIAGGRFGAANGTRNIARWDGQSWRPLAEGVHGCPPPYTACDQVNSLVVYDGRLIAGGRFTRAGSNDAQGVAAWDGASWTPMGGLPGSAVSAMLVHHGELLATYQRVHRWTGERWEPFGDMGNVLDHGFSGLGEHNGLVYAGGWSGTLMRFDGAVWVRLGSFSRDLAAIRAIGQDGGDLVLGGAFASTSLGGSQAHFASWTPNQDLRFNPLGESVGGYSGGSAAITASACGSRPMSFRWLRAGVPINPGPTSTGSIIEVINTSSTSRIVIRRLGVADADAYACEVSDGTRSIRSSDVNVFVSCSADIDDGTGTGTRDLAVTLDDLVYFVSLFSTGNAGADLDDGSGYRIPDGGVTIDDLLFFLALYEAGC